jgi:tetratricopeptide (TPR) repeat protein
VAQDPILELVEKASMLLGEGNYDNAIKIFDTILMLRSGHIQALNGKGVALCNQEKYQEALQCFNEVLKIKPRHPYASTYVKIIKDRISKERNAEAKASSKDIEQHSALEKQTEEKVKKALTDSTQIPSELIKRGDQFYEKAMYDEAILCYDRALKIEPRSELAWKNKGIALDAKGDYKEAHFCFEEALKINPNLQIYSDKIQVGLEKLGRNTSIGVRFTKARKQEPQKDVAYCSSCMRDRGMKDVTKIEMTDGTKLLGRCEVCSTTLFKSLDDSTVHLGKKNSSTEHIQEPKEEQQTRKKGGLNENLLDY